MIDAHSIVGKADILMITLDTLRYDVACKALEEGQTPFFSSLLPSQKWQRRHSPGSFTLAAHQSFFAGFLPTPVASGPHPRLFAASFAGSETVTEQTFVFDAPDIVTGFSQQGYRTICVGGVGFFNKKTPLSQVMPGLFHESYWSEELGVTSPESTKNQVRVALDALSKCGADQRVFLFLNISAIHQPNCIFAPRCETDGPETQALALAYVDRQLPVLFDALRKRSGLFVMVMSDHGTAYGEDGFFGHRLAHPVVWDVPYAEILLPKIREQS